MKFQKFPEGAGSAKPFESIGSDLPDIYMSLTIAVLCIVIVLQQVTSVVVETLAFKKACQHRLQTDFGCNEPPSGRQSEPH